ncbi:topless-related protein 4-like isoform X1 [Cornus florida]|uniref:topless-related protein 4-like isoform X1 n=1 Tax=Cornus florida TaxID=4283 RepID=UPI0028979199|nr:topless-related protein 4-like isoform X1 [Cornus florida]
MNSNINTLTCRDNEQLSKYGDTKSARGIMLAELKKLIEANPLFRDKLNFPTLKNSRLRTLINQSLNWQHQLCKNPKPNPDIKTLFVDHTCGQSQPNGARAPSPVTNPLMGPVPKAGGFPPLGAHGPFQQQTAAPLPTSLAGWMANPSPVPHPSASAGPIGFAAPNNAAILKRPRTPPTNNPAADYQTADSEHVLKRSRPFGISDEVNNLPVNILPVGYTSQSHGQTSYSCDDLPKAVVMTLNQGSTVKSMDFHPVQQILLLVGTNTGEIMVWELGSRERLVIRNFKVWDLGVCSMTLQASLTNDYTASTNRVIWSPDGTLLGVAYSKHIVHIYSYFGGDDLRNHLEIEAHAGSVNDLAFSYPNKQLCVVTCGEDRLIKVWDAVTGSKQYIFEGHEAPVYSVCPHHKESIQFIFSTATDGKIKAWLYDSMGSRVDYDAPGHSSTRMAYSADGTRLFSCGTNKEGDSFIVEWNESEGAVKRTYHGLGKRSAGVVQFDTTKNRFLAAGDEFKVKFWDMDSVNLLTTTDAEGGLTDSPCIRFNKEGILLAVSTNESAVKILANADGIRLLRTVENRSFDPSRLASAAVVKAPTISAFGAPNATVGSSIVDRAAPMSSMVAMNGDNRSLADVKPRIADEAVDKSRIWKLTEINEPSQCRSLRLPDNLTAMRVSRLMYTNSGFAILALAANAVHKLWKWQRNDRSSTGKATASVVPQLWQPSSGLLMTNDISDTIPEDPIACFALSKNDSYVMSASGGKISLFNMMTFKTMTTFMPPPPAATFLAFHPQDNNIIAIGMEDSSIQIYNVRVDEVKTKLRGHQKRITGLAFSNVANVLVSSGADSQLCVWSTDGWEKQTSKHLQIPAGRASVPLADTRVQFHQDQTHLLVVHETQIAIYEAPKLECLKQWVPREASGPITHATYSCDSQSIYVSFEDGSVGILTASTLRLRCRINPTSYLPTNPGLRVYPLVIAAHPSEPHQFALGLTDGGVHIVEPLESEGKWGTSPPVENGAGPSTISGPASSDQPQR